VAGNDGLNCFVSEYDVMEKKYTIEQIREAYMTMFDEIDENAVGESDGLSQRAVWILLERSLEKIWHPSSS
jgi:hypothetical protein